MAHTWHQYKHPQARPIQINTCLITHYLIEDARRRQDVFRNLDKYLRIIKEVVRSIDPDAEVYLFGSVAENRYVLSSDIDVLVITNADPGGDYSREAVEGRYWASL
ncbi:nucleotidyltransferase domain-containing protein [Vulcanisaeta distributa]|uniref:nucleotidyltransferase domain-containing protein n=1 Tax=Vulcanisaeta distributa TaxID=164451 RepID=UPI000B264439|nr:nucleotidyltransferase domain-containing protein [Vulcanisaeta distributa]